MQERPSHTNKNPSEAVGVGTTKVPVTVVKVPCSDGGKLASYGPKSSFVTHLCVVLDQKLLLCTICNKVAVLDPLQRL